MRDAMFEERSMKLVDENGGFELYQAYDHTIDRHGKNSTKNDFAMEEVFL